MIGVLLCCQACATVTGALLGSALCRGGRHREQCIEDFASAGAEVDIALLRDSARVSAQSRSRLSTSRSNRYVCGEISYEAVLEFTARDRAQAESACSAATGYSCICYRIW